MYFLAENKKAIMPHIKYSAMIAVAVIVLMFVLNGFFATLLNLVYWIGSAFLAFKAYTGEQVHIEILDNVEEKLEKKINETMKK
jgi:uncharacterized membrane protein